MVILTEVACLQAVTGGFIAENPPFANRAPSWIFEARAPGYERVSAKIPAPLPSLTLSTLHPAQTWPREFKMATSSRIPVFRPAIQPPACRL